MHMHAHVSTHTHTHTHTAHTHTTVWLREPKISNSQVLKGWHSLQAWVQRQDPTSGPTWRALLYCKSLGGALTDIHTVVRAKKSLPIPRLHSSPFLKGRGWEGEIRG